jgi:hypothetical protein
MSWRKKAVLTIVLIASLMLALGVQSALADPKEPPPGRPRRPLVHFRGVVEDRPEEDALGVWQISGRLVEFVEGTILDESKGPAEEGATVMVVAEQLEEVDPGDPNLQAILIRVLPSPAVQVKTIRGEVTELVENTSLVVNDLTILYDESTEISGEGELEVGALVKVRARYTEAGWQALSIDVLQPAGEAVEIEGIIEEIGDPIWIIGGQTVTVNQSTQIIGRPEIGLWATVQALETNPGEYLALVIRVRNEEPESVEFTGTIDKMPQRNPGDPAHYYGQWIIGGHQVMVMPETEIVGTPELGAEAHVVSLVHPRRPIVAQRIEIVTSEPAEDVVAAPEPALNKGLQHSVSHGGRSSRGG